MMMQMRQQMLEQQKEIMELKQAQLREHLKDMTAGALRASQQTNAGVPRWLARKTERMLPCPLRPLLPTHDQFVGAYRNKFTFTIAADASGAPDEATMEKRTSENCDLVQLAAMAAIGDPARPNPQLIRTARAAKNACAPGVVSRDNVFVRLSRLANRYVGETAAGRRELQDELATTAEAARLVLEPAERRERKDIDG